MRLLEEVWNGRKEGIVSTVSEIEVLVQPIRDGRWWEVEQARALLEEMTVVEVDRAVARMAAEVRATHRLGLADAAIVATAIVTRCDVLVGNDERCAQRVREVPYVLLDDLVKEQST